MHLKVTKCFDNNQLLSPLKVDLATHHAKKKKADETWEHQNTDAASYINYICLFLFPMLPLLNYQKMHL